MFSRILSWFAAVCLAVGGLVLLVPLLVLFAAWFYFVAPVIGLLDLAKGSRKPALPLEPAFETLKSSDSSCASS